VSHNHRLMSNPGLTLNRKRERMHIATLAARSDRAWTRSVLRLSFALIVCVLTGWGVRELVLTHQFDLLALQSRHHVEFFRMSLQSLLSRNESLPRVIAMEERLLALLANPSDMKAQDAVNNYLLDVQHGAGINAVYLMDRNGLTLAASNFQSASSYVGHSYAFRPYFQLALHGGLGRFYGLGATTGEPGYFLASPIAGPDGPIGVVVVKISLEDFESALVRNGDPVLLVDANGVVFLSSVPEFKYRTLMPLEADVTQRIRASRQYGDQDLRPLGISLQLQDEPQHIRASLQGRANDVYLAQSVLTAPEGWSIVLLSSTRQERQNALLAGVATGLAVAFALSVLFFFRLNIKRYHERRQAEAALRQAYADLEKRIAERTADLTATNASLEEKVGALKTTETILRETRDSAVQAGKLAVLGQMAAGISHELNQPLTALHTFADNAVGLLERGDVAEVRENLGLIRQMAARMGRIVGEIKSFTRKPALARRPVGVAGVVVQALMLVEARRRQVEAQIDTRGVPDDLQVRADPQRLEQVLVNLLLNALDAVADSAQRRVNVTACRVDGRVRIVVRDSGSGIEAATLPHLFEPFFTTKSVGQGLGLGLAISRMIASELGGSLDARNGDGGAEFTLELEKA
jgi:two-component system C4-dicarboxylate transport sensor histidine kinase DctB